MLIRLTHALSLMMLLPSCGSLGWLAKLDGDDDKPEKLARVTMTASAPLQEEAAFSFTGVDSCAHDAASGLLLVEYSEGNRRLTLAVRDFQTTPQTYRCAQAANNNDGAEDVGDLYENCMVEVAVPTAGGSTDTYSMHRATTATKRFAYDDACTIEVTAAEGTLRGAFTCAGMAQTAYHGRPRNPVALDEVNPEVTAALAGSFACKIHKRAIASTATAAAPQTFTTLRVEPSDPEAKIKTIKFPGTETCAFDAASGQFTVAFNAGGNNLTMAIRDFTTADATYDCAQAANNGSDADDVGDLFTTCSVSATVTNPTSSKGDTYAMHRATTAVKPFTYADPCHIEISVAATAVHGKISCDHVPQTHYQDLPRNPVATDGVHADVSAGLSGAFRCYLIQESN